MFIEVCVTNKRMFVGHFSTGSRFYTVQDARPAVSEDFDSILFRKTELWCIWRGNDI